MPRPHSPDLILTPQDFDDCRWQDALSEVDPWSYRPISDAFLNAAEAVEDERQATALRLLTNICFLKFSPDKAAEPYAPCFSSAAGRSFSLDDLVDGDIAFLARAAANMDADVRGAPLLKARLADVVWLVQRPRNIDYALLAIDSYRAVPLNVDTWLGDGLHCWQRALLLARLTKTRKRGDEMEASILDAFDSATDEDGFLAVKLAELMRSNGLGLDGADTIATKLKSLGDVAADQSEFLRERSYLHEAHRWFKTLKDDAQATAATVAEAECWVQEAKHRLSSADPSHGVAASFIENAIQTYRTIPKKQRETHDGAERLKDLQTRLREYGRQAVDELTLTQGPKVDLSDCVRRARTAVTGKTTTEALTAFADLHPWVSANELRDSAIEMLRQCSISAFLFSSTSMSHDGRVVAKASPAKLGSTPTGSDGVVRDQMLREYNIRADLVTRSSILPALEVLRFEHRLREIDFIERAGEAAIVPPGRALLFGKALSFGYDGDFAAALHLLTPQIEHMVRFHLNRAGVETRHLDNNGIQTEKGLSALLDPPASSEVFGTDVALELNFLFTEGGGANLRNVVAHGLLSDMEATHGVYPIYAWWLTLKLVGSRFWNMVSLGAEEAGHNRTKGRQSAR